MINKELEKIIEDSKMQGVWSGYIRREYSDDLLKELLESGDYLKIKLENPLHKNKARKGRLWTIVKKGFERSITK